MSNVISVDMPRPGRFIRPGEYGLNGNLPRVELARRLNRVSSVIIDPHQERGIATVSALPNSQLLEEQRSIKLMTDLLHFGPFDGIALVPPSCGGKSTFVKIVKEAVGKGELDGVDTPMRYTTRARRPDDDPTEGETDVPIGVIDEMIADGKIGLRFQKNMGGVYTDGPRRGQPMIEMYAYEKPKPGSLAVYALGSSGIKFADSVPEGMLEKLVIGHLYVDDAQRAELIARRSGDAIAGAELEYRLRKDSSKHMLRAHTHGNGAHVDFVIKNYPPYRDGAPEQFVQLVKAAREVQLEQLEKNNHILEIRQELASLPSYNL